jgi:hypothetical protein
LRKDIVVKRLCQLRLALFSFLFNNFVLGGRQHRLVLFFYRLVSLPARNWW